LVIYWHYTETQGHQYIKKECVNFQVELGEGPPNPEFESTMSLLEVGNSLPLYITWSPTRL